MTLAVCLITRNGAMTIGRFLASIRPHVDEVCILDTGSTDGTLDLLDAAAAQPGAPIIVGQTTWSDDYAAARNRSFEMASSDYLAWADDDEVFEGFDHVRELLDEKQPDALYVRRVELLGPDDCQVNMRLRVVRASLGLRWTRPIHEVIDLPTGTHREAADPNRARVVHHEVRQAGRHNHRPLVLRELAKNPRDRNWLVWEARYRIDEDHDFAGAVTLLERAVSRDEPWKPSDLLVIALGFVNLCACRLLLNDREGAERASAAGNHALRLWRTDPFVRRCEDLGRAEITKGDPMWCLARSA